LAVAGGMALLALLLSTRPATAQALDTNKTDTADAEWSPTDYNNWITFGVGSTFVESDKAQFQHQRDTKRGPFGGVEDFHWQEFVGKKGIFKVDGHGIFDNHDYAIKLDLTDPTKGYLRAGFTEFRTWYDGNGGFFPKNGQWFSLYDNDLHLDRGSAWFEAGLTLPDKPVFTIRYEHDFRKGEKDSTVWGETTLTGQAAPLNQRKIVPAFWVIDETRDIILADVKHKIGNTDAGLGVRYEIDRNSDALNMRRQPGEAANRYITQSEISQNDLFNVHGFTETFFNKKVTFSTGGSFTTIDTDLSGNRIYGPNYNSPLSTTYVNNGTGFTGLTGGGNTKEYVANINLMITPMDNLVLVPAFRFEHTGSDLTDNFRNTSGVGAGFVSAPTSENNNNWYLDVAESFEIRYTGFRNWSLYTSGEWTEDTGNTVWNETTAIFTPLQNLDWTRLGQKYTVGANWYPAYRLNFGGQYYHQTHDYSYDNRLANVPATYPGYLKNQNFTVDDMNIRATWRALNNLSLVTRYDFQYSTVDTTSIPNAGASYRDVESANITSHIISENVSWTPLARLYLQLGGSYVLNTLNTPVASSAGINNLVQNNANNYWTIDTTAGYALNDKTDLQVLYTYYRANNFVNNSASSQPYGAGDEQHGVTSTLTRRITKALQVSLKYGFFANRDQTSGNHNNFTAHLVYANMTYRF
jgi:hypothetical protein